MFTIIIQNAVPFHELGVATSNLTFFRQIGGSVGLAVVGTIFGSSFQEQLVPRADGGGCPGQVAAGFGQACGSGAIDFDQLTGVGDLGQAILGAVPADSGSRSSRSSRTSSRHPRGVQPRGRHRRSGSGVAAAAIAAVAASTMHEHALRTSTGPARAPHGRGHRVSHGGPVGAPD